MYTKPYIEEEIIDIDDIMVASGTGMGEEEEFEG